jgi:hypothetical protein
MLQSVVLCVLAWRNSLRIGQVAFFTIKTLLFALFSIQITNRFHYENRKHPHCSVSRIELWLDISEDE